LSRLEGGYQEKKTIRGGGEEGSVRDEGEKNRGKGGGGGRGHTVLAKKELGKEKD